MAEYEFILRNNVWELNGKPIGKFDAFFSEMDKNGKQVIKRNIPDYVRVGNNTDYAILKSNSEAGGNHSIFVSPGVLDNIPNKSSIAYEKATKSQFFFYRIKKDRLQKWAFFALVAALLGVMIDVGFAIGKIHVLIPLSESQTIMLLGLGMVLKVVGLWLVFRKGFWEQK